MNKMAIWRAVNSIHGERLVQIAVEHTKLAKELILHQNKEIDTEIIESRIVSLREEREGILELYEEEDDKKSVANVKSGRRQLRG